MKRISLVIVLLALIIQISHVKAIKGKTRQDINNYANNDADNTQSLKSGVTIQPSNYERSSVIDLQASKQSYASLELAADSNSFKIINSSVDVVEVDQGLFNVNVDAKVENIYIEEDILNRQSDLKIWKMFLKDVSNPSEEILGWTDNSTSQCGNIFMLGGFNNFAKGEVKKSYNSIPEHTMVRIIASYHFIDQWMGEVGFLKINSHLTDNAKLEYAWVQKYDTSKINSENPINVCGSSYPEFQLSHHIDIVVPHNKDTIILAFGSTLEAEDPAEASFGVSNIQIFIQ